MVSRIRLGGGRGTGAMTVPCGRGIAELGSARSEVGGGCSRLNSFPPIYIHLKPHSMILLGTRVFAGVIKMRIEMRSCWIRVGPKSHERILIRSRKEHTEIQGRRP